MQGQAGVRVGYLGILGKKLRPFTSSWLPSELGKYLRKLCQLGVFARPKARQSPTYPPTYIHLQLYTTRSTIRARLWFISKKS